jgi:hypothetical protein
MRTFASFGLGIVLAACGGGGDQLPDGSPGADAMPDSDGMGPTTVRVVQERSDPNPGAAIEGARIQVVLPDGTARDYVTDATGAATVQVATGSQLWIARDPLGTPTVVPGGSSAVGQLYYFTSIEPDRSITVGGVVRESGSENGSLTINYTPYGSGTSLYHDGFFYSGGNSCTDGGVETTLGTIVYETYAGCAATARELVITAFDPKDGSPQAWLRVPDVAPVNGTIDATDLSWDPTGVAYTYALSDPPADVTSTTSAMTSAASWHYVSAAGDPAAPYSVQEVVTPTPASILTTVRHQLASPQYVLTPVTTFATTEFTVDGAGLLPFVQGPEFAPATRTISWTEVSAGSVAPALATASFSYYDNTDFTQYRWTIYAPPGAAAIEIPDVPDAVTTHDIHAGDTVYPDLWLIEAEGATYGAMIESIDLYRTDPQYELPPTARAHLSGGFPSKDLHR